MLEPIQLITNLNMGAGNGSTPPATIAVYPDPFAAISTTAAGTPNPMLATSTTTVDPWAAVSRLKGT